MEINVQAQIKASIRKDGGYCHKLTNRFTIGIPDLLVVMPPFAPCLIEVKDLGVCAEKFDRQLGITPKQRYELIQVSDVYTPGINVSAILVHLVHKHQHLLVALPRHTERMGVLSLADPSAFRKRGVGGYWAIRPLLEHLRLARVEDPRL